MPRVFYLIEEKLVEADATETILQASLRAAIPHAHTCGGNARCSTCRVMVAEGLEHCAPRNEKEQHLAERLRFGSEIRLACQTTISGDVKLRRLVMDEEDIELTDQLGAGATPTSAGEEKSLAILFADIRGFTPFAERLLPYDVVHVLNRYYYEVGEVIANNGGRIDNYMGDGFMALFGMEEEEGAALNAVKASLEMLEVVERLKPYMEAVYGRSFQIGIGVHYGEAVVGAIGAAKMKRVTAIGDAVNLASRIESATKQAGARILISESAYNEVKDHVTAGKTVKASLAGKSGEYLLYEVIGLSRACS
jgi:adenylate cyclase